MGEVINLEAYRKNKMRAAYVARLWDMFDEYSECNFIPTTARTLTNITPTTNRTEIDPRLPRNSSEWFDK